MSLDIDCFVWHSPTDCLGLILSEDKMSALLSKGFLGFVFVCFVLLLVFMPCLCTKKK